MRNGKSGESVDIREVYSLVDTRFGQLTAAMVRLENKFDALESGRLSSLESKTSNLEGRLIMVPFLISTAISVFAVLIEFFLRR